MTTITWFILVSLFLPQAGIRVDQPWHAQLGLRRPPPAQIGPGRPPSAQICPGRPLPAHSTPGCPAYYWRPQLWPSSRPRRSWPRPLRTCLRWQSCLLWPRCWPGITLPLPLHGQLSHSASSNGNACVSGASFCVLVGPREALHGCMGGDGPRPHGRKKGWRKPLLFLRFQTRVSARRFYVYLFLSRPPRKMRKNDG